MNIPGVTMVAAGRTPARTSRRPPVAATPKNTNMPGVTMVASGRTPARRPPVATPKCYDPPKTPTVNIPPPTPSMRKRAIERFNIKVVDKEGKYEHDWKLSDAEIKINSRSPYMPRTINYCGVEVFIPPDIDLTKDKIRIVDLGGLDKEESRRYMIVKEKFRPVEEIHFKGEISYIGFDDDGIPRRLTWQEEKKLPRNTQKGLVIPVCSTPRITEAPRNNGLSLNILAEMTK